ncbi:hypothetical protein EDD15DRAFT_2191444 [Pisolithus albus]|nr:hypothetical protein EDD15DRAFT_2191444 [Pisolithus albus]
MSHICLHPFFASSHLFPRHATCSRSQAPVQAVSSKFNTLQSPTPTESSWYLVGSNESLSSLQDKLFSQGSHNVKLDKSVLQRHIDVMEAEVVVSTWTQWHSHLNTMRWCCNHVRVWGQIWCGKYGFEHEGEYGRDLHELHKLCPRHFTFLPCHYSTLLLDAHVKDILSLPAHAIV